MDLLYMSDPSILSFSHFKRVHILKLLQSTS